LTAWVLFVILAVFLAACALTLSRYWEGEA